MKKFWAILIAVAFIAMASMPVMAASTEERITAVEKQLAASWKFYGSVRVATFYNDFKAKDNHKDNNGSGINDKGTRWALQTNSRIGANVAIGDIAGQFEYGHGGKDADKNVTNDPTIRLLYGSWNFGPGKIVIGKDYTPLYWDISNKVYADDSHMYGFGQFYGGREAQIKLIYGAFQVALIDPTAGAKNYGWDGTDVYLPRIEASYDLNFGPVTGRVIAGYKTYDVVDNEDRSNEEEESIDSYILALALKYTAGPFYASIAGFYAQNVTAYAGGSMSIRTSNNYVANGYSGSSAIPYFGSDTDDCKTWGATVAVGYKVNDMVTFEAGFGYQEDKWSPTGATFKETAMSYYIQAPLTIAKNFWIVPEAGIETFKAKTDINGVGDDSAKLGKSAYFGVKWQINF